MVKRFFQRAYHFLERIYNEGKRFPNRISDYGWNVAYVSFIDGLIPPGKSLKYIKVISSYVNNEMSGLIKKYNLLKDNNEMDVVREEVTPIWCCWWQGVEQMPEIVKLCHERLKQVIPKEAELHIITLDNYKKYVDIDANIIKKYNDGIITMTTMSDVLRFALLNKYGGYWLDATVFFTGDIPKEYFKSSFYCQRMVGTEASIREACRGNWCGFSMAGNKGNIVFRYMEEAFIEWWKKYDSIVDYVLIDYLLLSGYDNVSKIKEVIDTVPNNNEDIFEFYKQLNKPYTKELYDELTKNNVMHKLTYKMDLTKETDDGQMTLYGYLHKMVYGQ